MTRLIGTVRKGWGSEEIFVSNDLYCGKFMNFNTGAKFSMHFHKEKQETWYVLSGLFEIHWIDPKDASRHLKIFGKGDVWTNEPLQMHQIVCVNEGTILEISTPDSVEDNYRVLPGDSQK
jgi:mannose-6-phosphate isomerase-like protein (cupin superfamily)